MTKLLVDLVFHVSNGLFFNVFFSYIRVYLINNIMLILVIHIDVYVLFQILFPFRLGEHNIEQQHWALC